MKFSFAYAILLINLAIKINPKKERQFDYWLVTSFFDFGFSHKTSSNYFPYFENLLSMRIPLIIYMDDRYLD